MNEQFLNNEELDRKVQSILSGEEGGFLYEDGVRRTFLDIRKEFKEILKQYGSADADIEKQFTLGLDPYQDSDQSLYQIMKHMLEAAQKSAGKTREEERKNSQITDSVRTQEESQHKIAESDIAKGPEAGIKNTAELTQKVQKCVDELSQLFASSGLNTENEITEKLKELNVGSEYAGIVREAENLKEFFRLAERTAVNPIVMDARTAQLEQFTEKAHGMLTVLAEKLNVSIAPQISTAEEKDPLQESNFFESSESKKSEKISDAGEAMDFVSEIPTETASAEITSKTPEENQAASDIHTVERGENLWNLLEKRYSEKINQFSKSKQNEFINSMLDKLAEDGELRTQAGLESSNNYLIIKPGDELNFRILDPLVSEVLKKVEPPATQDPDLTPESSEASVHSEDSTESVPQEPIDDIELRRSVLIKKVEGTKGLLDGIFSNHGSAGTFEKIKDFTMDTIGEKVLLNEREKEQWLATRNISEDGWGLWINWISSEGEPLVPVDNRQLTFGEYVDKVLKAQNAARTANV